MSKSEGRWAAPLLLQGKTIRLEPLSMEHLEGLFEASRDPSVWTYLTMRQPADIDEMRVFVSAILEEMEAGRRLCFAIRREVDGAIVGTTSLFDFSTNDRKLEIGHTWLSPNARRSSVNTEAKLLLLRHCFESLGCVRVQLKTDARNEASRKAIERLGAVCEGTLRKFQMRYDGFIRDTAMYSILESEWPSVRDRLSMALSQRT